MSDIARYIDADALIKVLDAKADMAMGTPKKVFLSVQTMVNCLPPADVAPRAEMAREIFWEMDKLLLSITIDEETEESFVGFDFDKYIVLKKKYTRAEPEPPKGD